MDIIKEFKESLVNDLYTLFPFSKVVIAESETHACVKVCVTVKGEALRVFKDFYVEEFNESKFYREEVKNLLIWDAQEKINKILLKMTPQI